MAGVKHIERESYITEERDDPMMEVRSEGVLATQVVDYILGVAEILLSLRFLFKLFGANPDAGFASFIYAVTDPLMAPFRAIFPSTAEQGAVFEWSVLVAMAIYALVAWAVIRLIEISTARTVDHYETHR